MADPDGVIYVPSFCLLVVRALAILCGRTGSSETSQLKYVTIHVLAHFYWFTCLFNVSLDTLSLSA